MDITELDDLLEELLKMFPYDNKLLGIKVLSDEIIKKTFIIKRKIKLFLKKKEIDIKI